jgi:hypothetical protein
MKKFIYLTLIASSLFIWSCAEDNKSSNYLRWVGDSTFDPTIDSDEFKLCHSERRVKQYFHSGRGMQITGEKSGLLTYFSDKFEPVSGDQNGLVRIRFIVNWKGETGRFRLLTSDMDYKEIKMDTTLTMQLLNLTKQLDGWKSFSDRGKEQDYYQYLVFKIENGNIIDIMP